MELRDAILADAAAIAALTTELGYHADAEAIAARLGRVIGRSETRVCVAVVSGQVAGWVQAHASVVLESGFRVEIVGLVVGQAFRRRGIGRALVQKIEEWSATFGAFVVVVRSNVQREESHTFYPALGYSASKTQHVYRKLLPEKPNKAPEPTTTAGTSAAKLPRVPTAVVAHL